MIAAVALCLALARVLYPAFRGGLSGVRFDKLASPSDWWGFLSNQPWVALRLALYGSLGMIVLLAIWSLAFMLMRLRRPRPPLDRVALQPGMVAVEAVLAGIILTVGLSIIHAPNIFRMLTQTSAIPVAWASLAVTGRWQPEAGWIDRFGRMLGIGWCLMTPTYFGLLIAVVKPPLW